MIYSMTGFASRGFSFQGQQFRIELKSLNHRFLELKLRIPRELNALESVLRPIVEKKLKRGSVELWIDRQAAPGTQSDLQINLPQATHIYGLLAQLKEQFKLSDLISVRDLTSFPDVIVKSGAIAVSETALAEFQNLVVTEVQLATEDLIKMRAQEGDKLKQALLLITGQFRTAHERLLAQRQVIRTRAKEKIKKRIELCFEAYPATDSQLRALMDTRISQEIAISLDRLDIEEELTRYTGHIEQMEKLLQGDPSVVGTAGGVGKKMDFLLQELNREVNTLGNKSQDLEMSQEVIQLKMWVEQLREQCLNLE